MLELGALALVAAWGAIALTREVALPPRLARIALVGLLAIAAVQLIPIGHGAVGLISPRAEALRAGLDPAPAATLSLAPHATASALRTGAALAGLIFVATSVVAARGGARLAAAALVSAAFQGLYGLLVLASGHDRIWNVPKTAYLDSATGTFVNRNHFAGFLAAALPFGIGLVVVLARNARGNARRRPRALAMLGPGGSRALLWGLLALTGLAGLLLSFSRAGIVLGLGSCAAAVVIAVRGKPVHRLAAIGLVLAIAAVPLADLGADRLAGRYASSGEDFTVAGGRLMVWKDTLRMIAAFPAAGCGFGAYTWVYPAFSSPDVRLHYTHAHQDLLQLGAEGGLPALACFSVLLVSLFASARKLVSDGGSPVLIGAALGVAALLLHGLVDFDFHIPADAALAAVLGGAVFGASWTGRS
jgi:O-antigen ligase